jgi:hypothetical protein
MQMAFDAVAEKRRDAIHCAGVVDHQADVDVARKCADRVHGVWRCHVLR